MIKLTGTRVVILDHYNSNMTGRSNFNYTGNVVIWTRNLILSLGLKRWCWFVCIIFIIVGFEMQSVLACTSVARLKFELAKFRVNGGDSTRRSKLLQH